MPGIADLLVNLTRSRFQPSVTKISTAYTLPDRNFPPSSFQGSAGRRRAVAQTLTHAGIRIANARAVAEPIGERRTPVWFPRPVGPQYGLGWPSVSALTLPAQIPGLESYENYVVVGNWRTEAAQALSNLAQRDRGARWLHQRAEKPSRRTEATGLRWACVAEMRGGGTFRRAWAYGKDPYAVSAAMAVVAVGALLRGEVYARASMAMLSDAEQILDDLTATTGLRFSVSDPMEDRPL